MSNSERRQFGRMAVEMAVVATAADGKTYAGPVRDLSLDGLFICCKVDGAAQGMECHMLMTNNGGPRPLVIQSRGLIRRVTPGGIGISFTAIGAEELKRIYHLLMEYSLIEG
ncbi:MAG: PilZ domain-containing protein [Nitrospirota bacterium]|nr:PilZ domain-containing protein [Nitrospirota bacterium]